jgi:transporter family-2 protein
MFTGALGGIGNAPAGFRVAPWWAFIGGACGAVYVVASVVALPKIGAARAVCAAIVGQQVASLLFDTFGWMGVPKTPLTPGRIAGSILLFVGVVLLQRK